MPLYGRPISSSSSDSPAAIVVGQQRSNLAKTLLKVLQESNYGSFAAILPDPRSLSECAAAQNLLESPNENTFVRIPVEVVH